ncbi:MAG TPA: DUF1549 domain-containing protein, partial [Armatimonadota bacterium]|nr:DUF1549 domain-containing protein [Armatimonadota bacterium]
MLHRVLPAFLGLTAPVALALAALAAPAHPGSPAAAPLPAALDFNRDVRPILAENCFACHGVDRNKRQAGLRLDTAEGATEKLKSGKTAVVPGHPEQSGLIERITARNALVMPPAATGKHLTPRQIAVLRQWVAQGGKYAPHWAYILPTRPEPPPLPKGGLAKWPLNPIDRFLLARMQQEGLKPSPVADRSTLMRRLSLDLTGLPPTPEELDAFLKDRRPGAYERVVDRLLASPHYGERMAVYWLDLVRYADTV